jgi:hypothetical protein
VLNIQANIKPGEGDILAKSTVCKIVYTMTMTPGQGVPWHEALAQGSGKEQQKAKGPISPPLDSSKLFEPAA